MSQLTFADMVVNEKRKASRVSIKLEKINKIVNWDDMLELVQVVDYTDKQVGGRPPRT